MKVLEEVVLWCISIIAGVMMFPFMLLFLICEGIAKAFIATAQANIWVVEKIFDTTKGFIKILEKKI